MHSLKLVEGEANIDFFFLFLQKQFMSEHRVLKMYKKLIKQLLTNIKVRPTWICAV